MQDQSEEIKLSEIVLKLSSIYYYLLKKWKLIIICGLLGSIIGLFVSINSKPHYKSSLSFVVEGKTSANGLASLVNSMGLGGNLNNQVFTPENIIELMKSRTLIERTLLMPRKWNSNESLADLYVKMNNLNKEDKDDTTFEKVYFKPFSSMEKLSLRQNKIIKYIHNQLITKELEIEIRNPKNSIIYIDLNTTNEEFSRYFPEYLISVTSEHYIESKTRKAKLNYETIKKQTDSVRQELNNAISGVAVANDETFLLNPAYNVKRVPSAHNEVDVQANTAILTELVKNLELSRMNLLNETPVIEIIDSPISPLKKEKLGKTKGILIGGIISGILIISFLTIMGYIKKKI